MSKVWDLIIVGAGPIGCKVGELLGKDYDVLIIDRKKEIGKPVQCSGFNSERIFELSGVSKKVILNKVIKSDFFSPSGTKITLKSKIPFYVFDRELFDKEIAKKTEKNNVEIRMKTDFKSLEKRKEYLEIKTNHGKIKSKLLVGADGPGSTVSRVTELPQPDNLLIGYQKTIKYSYNPTSSELWFGDKVCPGFFAWVVPENDEWARVAVATYREPVKYFDKFVKKRIGKNYKSKDDVSGLIRFGLIKKSVDDRILLVGDAASQVKPFSGGGLIYGLMSARIAAEACDKSLNEGRYDYEFLKENYGDEWKKMLRWPILKGLGIRRFFDNCPDWILNLGFGLGKHLTPIFEGLIDEDLL
ncbi:MAG: geranylgeranyl reductase family protein [Candidatus Aenigmarchaeota archaeon]|nr:geranylgeranyl reductase family protein [Candidatus Aenigmarchaeota archaeon]